jgi:hypothetical protein
VDGPNLSESEQLEKYLKHLMAGMVQVDEDQVLPIEQLLNTWGRIEDRTIRLRPAAEYLKHGILNLRFWANQVGLFSIPTLELATWLFERHPNLVQDCHEIGAGGAVLAQWLGYGCSDSRDNVGADLIAKALGSRHAIIPDWVPQADGTAIVCQMWPRVVLAQWVTPGGVPGGNGYGPNFAKVLTHCEELIFIGNDFTHGTGLAQALPPADEEYRPDWLLSRGKYAGQNFIRIWKGGLSPNKVQPFIAKSTTNPMQTYTVESVTLAIESLTEKLNLANRLPAAAAEAAAKALFEDATILESVVFQLVKQKMQASGKDSLEELLGLPLENTTRLFNLMSAAGVDPGTRKANESAHLSPYLDKLTDAALALRRAANEPAPTPAAADTDPWK